MLTSPKNHLEWAVKELQDARDECESRVLFGVANAIEEAIDKVEEATESIREAQRIHEESYEKETHH